MITLNSLVSSGKVPISPLFSGWNAARTLSHVTIIEDVRIQKWMRGKEFLLVNTKTLSDIEDVPAFVATLERMHCSALAIKVTDGIKPPEDLLAEAEKRHLPLFLIAENATYLDVMIPINDLLISDERRSFFDALTARHLIDSPSPSLEEIQLEGVEDFRSERVIACHSSMIPRVQSPRYELEDLMPLVDALTSLIVDAAEEMVSQGLIDAHVLLADTLEIQELLFLPPETDAGAVFSRIDGLLSGAPFPIGVSQACDCLHAHEAALQARFAFCAGDLVLGSETTVRRYRDVEFYRLVEDFVGSEATCSLFAQTDRLADHPQLLETLSTFFMMNEQLKPTSERLFIHVNTLRYRLEQITKITGLDWTSTPDKIRLFLGIIHIRQRRGLHGNGTSGHSPRRR